MVIKVFTFYLAYKQKKVFVLYRYVCVLTT